MKRVVIFASGSGSTFQYLVDHAEAAYVVVGLFCDQPKAGVIARAKERNIPVHPVESGFDWPAKLSALQPDLIVLAGYLKLLPEAITRSYQVINTHPALLPTYGGQGFYGERVHRAVLEAGERLTGITIHRVDEAYDRGEIISQRTVMIRPEDTPQSLASRVQAEEKPFLLQTIKQILEEK